MTYHQITIWEALAVVEQQQKDLQRVFCKRCGRELKNSVAKELGYGPMCYKKHLKENLHEGCKKLFTMNN